MVSGFTPLHTTRHLSLDVGTVQPTPTNCACSTVSSNFLANSSDSKKSTPPVQGLFVIGTVTGQPRQHSVPGAATWRRQVPAPSTRCRIWPALRSPAHAAVPPAARPQRASLAVYPRTLPRTARRGRFPPLSWQASVPEGLGSTRLAPTPRL